MGLTVQHRHRLPHDAEAGGRPFAAHDAEAGGRPFAAHYGT